MTNLTDLVDDTYAEDSKYLRDLITAKTINGSDIASLQ